MSRDPLVTLFLVRTQWHDPRRLLELAPSLTDAAESTALVAEKAHLLGTTNVSRTARQPMRDRQATRGVGAIVSGPRQ